VRALERGDPRAIGRYRLLARLGVGGMAIVYFGRSPGHRAVAVKVMHADFAAEAVYRDRFRREVTATRAVGGRYCPAVLDADLDAGIPWLATEFLPAVSLRDAVRDHGPLPVDVLGPLAAGLAEALDSVHRAGIVHLDVKPANVLLTFDGPRLIDFGIAAAPGSVLGGAPAGSWGFMSPEQAVGGTVGPASDVYSFGATLAFAGSGTGHAAGGLARIADGPLRETFAACLCPDPAGRPTVADLRDRLSSAGAGSRWLPGAVLADLDRRAGEAKNPPVPLPPARRVSRRMSRRALLLAGGLSGGGFAAVGVAAVVLREDGSPPGGSAVASSPATSSPAAPPSRSPNVRTLEIYVFGRTTVRTLTTVVDGETETLQGVALPYRRVVQVPVRQEKINWRLAFHCSSGMIQYNVSIDGYQISGGGRSSTSQDMQDEQSGTT
jgi:hypothetical protein